MSSQPIYRDTSFLETLSQPEGQQVTLTTVGRAPVSEAKTHWADFEASLPRYLAELNTRKQELKRIIAQAPPPPPTELKVYYFIGRLNPPHEGHIETLKNLIEEAMRNNEIDGQPYEIII